MNNKKSTKPGIIELLKYAFKNFRIIKAARTRDSIKNKLYLVNMEIGQLNYHHPLYMQRVREFNQAFIEYYKGRWYATQASQTGSKDDWKKSSKGFKQAEKLRKKLYEYLQKGIDKPIEYAPSTLENKGTEITYADDVPMVPEITPIIIIQGSNYDMGFQYAKQLVEIFGRWILERRTGKNFSGSDLEFLRKWEDQHKEHTPWLIDFCKGWSDSARELGINMTYEEVLSLWVGNKPPAQDFLDTGGLPEIPPLACSGVAAWGEATKDGKLVTGSTGDHELGYQVTIIGFPEEGNNFIYSPFGATGEIPGAGEVYFFGHPAMNDKGLIYVHHGGGPKFLEPRKYWGYGLRRAASVIHCLRYCDNAKQAKEMELSWPIGDIGWGDQATVGGFYADGSYTYIIEGRKEPKAIRESGILGENDFIYANNSTCHPKAIKSEWMSEYEEEWMWDEHGGWRPIKPVGMTKSLSLFFAYFTGRLNEGDLLKKGMMFAYTNSCERNKYFYEMMSRGWGNVDLDFMKMIYQNGGTIPQGKWDKIVKEYTKTGRWGEISTGHASNAMTVVTKPSEGIYCLCTGPAKRGLAPMMPTSAIPIYNETNAFWEIKLDSSPKAVMEYARNKAVKDIKLSKEELQKLEKSDQARDSLLELIESAETQFEQGEKVIRSNNTVYEFSKATRCYIQSQVRSRQVINALASPPSSIDTLKT